MWKYSSVRTEVCVFVLYFLCCLYIYFCFPVKNERRKKLFIYPKQFWMLLVHSCFFPRACTLHAVYNTEQFYWRWLFWYFWRWVLIHHSNQITKKEQSWISLYYSVVWSDTHKVKITLFNTVKTRHWFKQSNTWSDAYIVPTGHPNPSLVLNVHQFKHCSFRLLVSGEVF